MISTVPTSLPALPFPAPAIPGGRTPLWRRTSRSGSRLRDGRCNERPFAMRRHARDLIAAWGQDDNRHRPPTRLDGLTWREYRQRSVRDQDLNRANQKTRSPWGAGQWNLEQSAPVNCPVAGGAPGRRLLERGRDFCGNRNWAAAFRKGLALSRVGVSSEDLVEGDTYPAEDGVRAEAWYAAAQDPSGGLPVGASVGLPCPGQAFIQPPRVMGADAAEAVGEIGFRVKAKALGGLDHGHGVGQHLAARVGACEQEILPSEEHGLEGALGAVVVEGDAAIIEEQGEAGPAGAGMSPGLCPIALAGDQRQLALASEPPRHIRNNRPGSGDATTTASLSRMLHRRRRSTRPRTPTRGALRSGWTSLTTSSETSHRR